MGWWNAGKYGGIAEMQGPRDNASERDEFWGDGPADILDGALDQIEQEFQEVWGRKPYISELRQGLEFSLGRYDEEEKE
jgi:hypothetical protein